MLPLLAVLCAGQLPQAALCAEPLHAQLTISAGKYDRQPTPIRMEFDLPSDLASGPTIARVQIVGGPTLPAQITEPRLHADAQSGKSGFPRDLHFIGPAMQAGQTLQAIIKVESGQDSVPQFAWHDTPGEYMELSFGAESAAARPVLRYQYKKLDESSKEARELTYKVFHHLFDPSGQTLLTKGPGGRYTHHRGLFFGFNRVSYANGEKTADVWHCSGDAHQSHEKLLASEAGPVLGRHRVLIDWHGPGKEVFATETRELTVFNVPGGQLVEFASRVESRVGPVKLDGDPQHAGFHFRASGEVADQTSKQTYYLRPDGKGELGQTRNWEPKTRLGPVNLPWNGMSFVLGGQRFTAIYVDRPENPKEARFSERDYGRFGSYFEYQLDQRQPLDVRYRVWVQPGEMQPAQAEALSHDLVEPIQTARIR